MKCERMHLLKIFSSFLLSNWNFPLLVPSLCLSIAPSPTKALIINGQGNQTYHTCFECSNYAADGGNDYTPCFQVNKPSCIGMYCFNALDNLEHMSPYRYFSGCLNLTVFIDMGPGTGMCYQGESMTKCVCSTDNCNGISGGPGLYCTRNDFLPYVDFSLASRTVTVNATVESALKLGSIISFNADSDYSSATNGTDQDINSVCTDTFLSVTDSTSVSGQHLTTSTTVPKSVESLICKIVPVLIGIICSFSSYMLLL